jgi:signal transduction histidine kinase/sugar lactone lactonase YvrE
MNTTALHMARDGSLWVASGSVTARWDAKASTVQTFDFGHAECDAMFEDSQGRMWLSMIGQGVFYHDRGRMIPFPDSTLTNNDLFVYAITEDHSGRFWLGTQMGIHIYDRDFQPQPSLPVGPKTLCILEDRQGTVWFGSDGDGLYCWRNGEASHFGKADGLADDHVTALCEDREGNLWVGTRGGVSLFSDVKFPLFSPGGDEQNASFHSVCTAADGGLWAGTSIGLFHFDGAKFVDYGTNAGLSVAWIKQVLEARNGDLYIADAARRVEILRHGKIVAVHECSGWQNGFAEDRQGMVVAVGPRLFRVDQSGLTPYAFTNPAPTFGWIRSIQSARDGTILVASVSGIFRVKDGAWDHLDVENGLPSNEALWLSADADGILWAGTAGGIARIDGNRVDSWTQDDGLFDNYVRAIIPDDEGWMWFHSAAGIFRVRRDSFMPGGRRTSHLDCEAFAGMDSVKSIGTADVEFSACKSSDGRIWIPSPEGIIMIDPAHVPVAANLPAVHVETVRINGREWSPAAGLAVEPGRGEMQIDYTAPTFNAPHSQQFRYRLEGYESNWEMVGSRRSAFFTNLKPGKYKFVVEACTADGLHSGQTDGFNVELLPFFYQTAWFYLLCAGLTLSVLLGVYTWRVSFLERKQRQLQVIQQRLEDEVRVRTGDLRERTALLEKEIEERKQAERQVEQAQHKLMEASRLAGMAEVATGVLHNVGNVLNSVNISTSVVTDRVRGLKVPTVARVAQLLKDHRAELGAFLASDPRGRQLPSFLDDLSHQLARDQAVALEELDSLHKHVDHIKQIVATQLSHAKSGGVTTSEDLIELAEESLRMNEPALRAREVSVRREFPGRLPKMIVDRHQVLQILVNLIRNAAHACADSGRADKLIVVRIVHREHLVAISVADNGVGIPPENLDRIFSHGFTTRTDGHGFGLHSGALAAKEMGGALRVTSEGPGRGAEFVLELPWLPAPYAAGDSKVL